MELTERGIDYEGLGLVHREGKTVQEGNIQTDRQRNMQRGNGIERERERNRLRQRKRERKRQTGIDIEGIEESEREM